MNPISCLLSIGISLVFLYYILEIEKEDCNCINDWRLRYIKMYNGGLILVNVVLLLLDKISINLKSYILSILSCTSFGNSVTTSRGLTSAMLNRNLYVLYICIILI